ncbi:HAD family hydrolase [uncultured Clostridium sp.]|jgi:hypothetical protein|uniref:HAD family hydrolase n=1 Tax=uncultured Clostridium sp. TaxID=59620 RepID=UPI00262F14DF|nr:HAD family hydrolase [uncultured Clostridium sp.]
MKNIKGVVFFDVDGTLIDCRRGLEEPSQKTKEAIEKLKENGYLTILATGRPMSFLGESLLTLGLDGYITSNGTYIELESEAIFDDAIQKDLMNTIIDELDGEKIDYLLEGQSKSYINNFETPGSRRVLDGFALPLNNITDKWDRDEISVSKIVIIDDGQATFKDFMLKYDNDFVFMQHPGQGSYDMYRRGCTKAYGIQHLIEKLEISVENTYAFGDGENDIEMFEFVKHGIAMGHSHPELLKVAYDTTEDVENDGIYKALVKMEMI